jgi:hypothetical protein
VRQSDRIILIRHRGQCSATIWAILTLIVARQASFVLGDQVDDGLSGDGGPHHRQQVAAPVQMVKQLGAFILGHVC